MRNLKKDAWRCAAYEFEDVICKIDDVEFFAPRSTFELNKNGFAKEFAYRFKRKVFFTPDGKKFKLSKNYYCLFFVCQNLLDLRQLLTIKRWRKHFKYAICWLEEVWLSELPECKRYINILSEFDHVIINCRGSLEALREAIPVKCYFSPAGVDAVRFCPYPDPPARSIDVFSLGRRSERMHREIMKLAEKQKIFYFYETFYDPQTLNPREHRKLIANLAQRSKYFWVGPAKFNKPSETCGQIEFGHRFFEGAASGCLLIGKIPECNAFNKYFDWADVVKPISNDCEDLVNMLSDLDSISSNHKKIRKSNIVQSLLRHDWIYRWKRILKILKLEPQSAFFERKQKLDKLIQLVGKV
jgi:hypothetical protein